MDKLLKKAVIPVAGRGTRIMPLTLHQPKGMVNIVDKPVVHYAIDEAVAAGVQHIVLVINPSQIQFRQYLDFLLKRDSGEWRNIKFDFAVQKKPLGNGHAVLCAKRFIGKDSFLLLWSDDIIVPNKRLPPPMAELVRFYTQVWEPIIALERFPRKELSRMGVVGTKKTKFGPNFYEIDKIVEKPKIKDAPSNLTVAGRYVITPKIVDHLEFLLKNKRFQRDELWLTDALDRHLEQGGRIFGWRYPNKRFDCGSKIGILKAQAYFGLHHKELGIEFRRYLRKALK